jgi:hypothetical protein
LDNLNLDVIAEKIKNGNFTEAISDYYSLITETNEPMFQIIFGSISEVLENENAKLNESQLNVIKPFLDKQDDEIKDVVTEIYIKAIKRNPGLLLKESEFLVKKASEAENRGKYLDLLTSVYSKIPKDGQLLITKFLISRLVDPLWINRMHLVEFFNRNLKNYTEIMKSVKTDFLILLGERDLDVIREDLDFLLNLIIMTYDENDIKELTTLISSKDWYAQQKLLWLIGKIGIQNTNLIKSSLPIIVKLLDHDDYLVAQEAGGKIEEIMNENPDLFDSLFFNLLQKEEIDNIQEIERLLKASIIHGGFQRFYQIFQKISPILHITILKNIQYIVKSLSVSHTTFVKNLFKELTAVMLKDFSMDSFIKFKALIEQIPIYDIFLTSFSLLNEHGSYQKNPEWESHRKDLIAFLLEIMPELNHLNLSIWLSKRIKQGPVKIEELCQKFTMQKDQLMEIIRILIEKNILDAIIENDQIETPTLENIVDSKPDLAFEKQWQVHQNLEDLVPEPKLFVKIKNISGVPIKKVNLVLVYPKNIFTLLGTMTQRVIKNGLEPNADVVVSWVFRKKLDEVRKASLAGMKMMIIYEKEGKFSSFVKKMDVLIL